MIEKRFLLKYSEYETTNGEIIKSEPYFVDISEEYIDEEYYFTIDGYPTMSDNQVVDLLNNYDAKLTEIGEIVKNFEGFWKRIPQGYCSSFDGVYIVMKKMIETITSIGEEVNDD